VHVKGCGGIAGDAASTDGLKVLFPLSVPLRMYAGLTLWVHFLRSREQM
jgi:hypothetical protein